MTANNTASAYGTWSFYETATGAFNGRGFSGLLSELPENTPDGCSAILGTYDSKSRRVNVASGQVEAWKPPAPPIDHLKTWAWDALSERWVSTPTLDSIRLKRWAEIKIARDLAEFSGFTWDGSTFDSDEQSQSRIQGAAQLATLAMIGAQAFSVDWTLANNTVRVLTGANMLAVGQAMGAHIMAAHGRARALRAALAAAQTFEQVNAVAW